MTIIYTDLMFNYTGAAQTTLSSLYAGTTGTVGTYSPQLDGTLVKITILVTPQAATSLCQDQRVELSQTNWTPNILRFPTAGYGLQTVGSGAWNAGGVNSYDYVVNQPVRTAWPITGNQICPGTGPVTPGIFVTGFFTA
jgi:hypothetical protein